MTKLLLLILTSAAQIAFAQEASTVPQVAAPVASAPVVAAPPAAPAPAAPDVVKEGGRVYIAVGDPNIRKALLAIEATGTDSVSKEFFTTMNSDMDFSDLFAILPIEKLPTNKGDMEAYKALGVEFVIASSVSSKGGIYAAEIRLMDVAKNSQIIGRRYPLVSKSPQPGRELAHYAGNDIVQALTGEPGIFRTRIIMSCGRRTKEIYIMDFDGENVRPITQDRNLALSPSWAPDGKRILFTSYKPAVRGGPLNPNLYMADVGTNQRKVVSAARGLNTGGVFHPKEEKIIYTFSDKGRPELYVLDLLKNIRTPITHTQFFSVEPDFSPDGTRIVYSSSQTSRPHIFVALADGTAAKRLTFAGQYNSSPKWSPKGDKIVFSGQENKANNFNIFMIDPSGSNLVRLTDSPSGSNENPVFAPDGRFLAYSGNGGGPDYRIYTMTSLGTRIRVLSPPALGTCKQPAWSPRL